MKRTLSGGIFVRGKSVQRLTYNVLKIGAGRGFTHEICYEELNFKITTFLSYEARKPCLSLFAVMGWLIN